jgi:ABC-type lipoprotein release transport system permease subunit
MNLLKISWRNLWRNKTRTAIAGTSIGFSFGLLLITIGLQEDSYTQMLDSTEQVAGGSVLINGKGWWEDPFPARAISDPKALLNKLEGHAGIKTTSARVILTGLLSSPRSAAGVELKAFDPEREKLFLDQGRFLKEGTFLERTDKRPLVLGVGVAKKLGIKLGDRVVFTTTDTKGEMNRALFRLTGLLESGSSMVDDTLAFTTIEMAQKAALMGKGISQIGVLAESPKENHALKESIQTALAQDTSVEIMTWQEAMPEMKKLIEVDRAQAYLMFIVILLVVAFGIANSMLMAVMERVRELGLQAALGVTPSGILGLIMTETFILGLVSMAGGLVLGMAGHLYFAEIGLDYAKTFGGGDIEMGGVVMTDFIMRSQVEPLRWSLGALIVFAVVMVSAIYPARRAARVEPARAMRIFE